ncbi:biotin--[acetyl-CoA-carboxylase] ligase [Halorarum salinum]|uniref:Biotin--[acetyl-CoA-carboxylase] ligase n=1 Tax=Halorarum salinum TaxID=2743089 RepID=A0A7D5LBJ0_9EURY|nr:biotin--[acetyl-CoA-carboxylase] ligase [Halobaculum salinum]QLG62650.1 biotin--[acetyl-CoA-carboxylase] ligase [Halobaculum salinum]
MTADGLPPTRRALLEALAEGPVEGPAFAERAGLTRAAVWKHVEALRGSGFDIESTDRGYEVAGVPGYDGPAIAYGLEAPVAVEFHDSVGSTNDRARELAAEGATDVAVVADEQTDSRGRLDREWRSPRGGVWLSILVRPDVPPAHAPAFTLAAAVAVARACREAGVDARIKWPNDVVVGGRGARGGRKLCGILTEMEGEADRVSWLVVGIGLNANVDPDDLPGGTDATSLARELGRDVDRRVLTQRVLEEFDDLTADPDSVLPAWREHADTLGRRVRVETPGDVVEGIAEDVAFPGALLVDTDDGEVRVTTGDCEHLRPAGEGRAGN